MIGQDDLGGGLLSIVPASRGPIRRDTAGRITPPGDAIGIADREAALECAFVGAHVQSILRAIKEGQ